MKFYKLKNKGIFFGKLERGEISALGRAKKNLFLSFEHYDLAIRTVDVSKFGEHLNIQISFKILRLGLS